MIPEFFQKILNSSYFLFYKSGYPINPLTLLENHAESIGGKVKYGPCGIADISLDNGTSFSLRLLNDGRWVSDE
jgi:hypothetical protein